MVPTIPILGFTYLLEQLTELRKIIYFYQFVKTQLMNDQIEEMLRARYQERGKEFP